MPSANKYAYLLETVRAALATDSTLSVQKVYNTSERPDGSRVIVYPFVTTITQNELREHGNVKGGTCLITIWADVQCNAEGATPNGNSFAAYASTLAKIEAAIATITESSQETHTDGKTTAIFSAVLSSTGGHVDNGDTTIDADCQVTLTFGAW